MINIAAFGLDPLCLILFAPLLSNCNIYAIGEDRLLLLARLYARIFII